MTLFQQSKGTPSDVLHHLKKSTGMRQSHDCIHPPHNSTQKHNFPSDLFTDTHLGYRGRNSLATRVLIIEIESEWLDYEKELPCSRHPKISEFQFTRIPLGT